MVYLNENFYLGGYYILKTAPRTEWMNSNVLHESILSASSCICDFHPDISIIWSKSKKKKDEYRKILGLDKPTYNEMEQYIIERFDKDFDYPDVFKHYENAVEFCRSYLSNQNGLKIIGVVLPKKYRADFLEDQADLRYGICKNIEQFLGMDINGKFLGYEILGFDFGGFHSYICNGLEDDYYDKYKLNLNNDGLISTIEEAELLSKFTNDVIEGTEPVLWLPWGILEYPL
jgi:hypothetical protein